MNDNIENQLPLKDNLHVWLQGHQDAIDLCTLIFDIAHVWDDLIDKDKPVSNDDIHNVFWMALIELPQNPFYARFFTHLHPLMKMGILNWKSANALEASTTPEHKVIAYALRLVITDIVTMCALLVGGRQWAEQVHLQMQLSSPESLSSYIQTLPQVEG